VKEFLMKPFPTLLLSAAFLSGAVGAAPANMLGIVAGQTARLTVLNLSAARSAPCRVELRFVGRDGSTLVDSDFRPVVSQVAVGPGVSVSIDLPAPGDALGAAGRLALRAVLRRINPGRPISPQCSLASTTELFESASGITTVALPQDPYFPGDPVLPIPRFGLFGIAAGQTARLNVVNLATRAVPAHPCRVELSFVGQDGQTFVNAFGQPAVSQLVLAPGASAFLDLPAPGSAVGATDRLVLRPVLRRITPVDPIAPQCRLVSSTELFNSVRGNTTVVMQPGDPF
jgi:hypothetical protein